MTESQDDSFDLVFDDARSIVPSVVASQVSLGAYGSETPFTALSEPARPLLEREHPGHTKTFDLAYLWNQLCSGKWRILDTFSTQQRSFAVVEQPFARSDWSAKSRRGLEMLKRVLLGDSQKSIAIDLGVSPSTAAGAMKDCLRAMGLRCRVSSVPVLLVMAAQAARIGRQGPIIGRIAPSNLSQGGRWVVSARRPDLDFPVRLSHAELEVARQLVEGRTHAQISDSRGTSTRTVANQLATVFRKLGVSGRRELVDALVCEKPIASEYRWREAR